MKILITGAFGNIGKAVIEESCKRGHEVAVFEVENQKTRKDAKKYNKKIETVVFGDIRNFEDVKVAVLDCDAVIHLAAIIPPASKKHRELTMDVNYGGTVNLIEAIKETKRAIPFIFTSSASVMGATQLQDKLVDRNYPLVVTGNYEESKIKCEQFLKENADNYLIFRLAGVLPNFSIFAMARALPSLEEIFDMHPDMRLEMIMDADVATAIVAGAEKLKAGTTQKNQAYILGGGEKNGWQLRGNQFLSRLFGALSLPVPDPKYFTQDINTYHLDWYDTKAAQEEFNFQNHTSEEYFNHIKKQFGVFKVFLVLFRKIIITKIEKTSPYYDKATGHQTEK
jgi:nucleoside-diphosphate-sugar epimerase